MKIIISIFIALFSITVSAQNIENKSTANSSCCTIKDLQIALQKKGYYKGKFNGILSNKFKKAFNSYIKYFGFPVPETTASWNLLAQHLGLDCRFAQDCDPSFSVKKKE